jgi:hypothetical protein
MKTGTDGSLKYMAIKMRLGKPNYVVTGVLESLWQMACRSAPDGDIGKHTNKLIAAGMEWDGDADELINALTETGWIDKVDDERRLVIHDWDEHCPEYIKKRKRSKESYSLRKSAQKNTDLRRNMTDGENFPSECAIAKPSQAKPSQEENAQSSDCLPAEEQLDSLIDSWNQLPQGIAPKVSERRSEPIVKGWRKVQRTSALKTALKDIPLLMTRIRDGTFLHGNGWFKFVWLFGKKDSQWNVLKILEGNYDRGMQTGNTRDTGRVTDEASRDGLRFLE